MRAIQLARRAKLAISFCAALIATVAHAKCVLPVADGGVEITSAPNTVGHIKTVNANSIRITEYHSKRTIDVDTTRIESVYTAFGGDAPKTELKQNFPVRIWYQNCKVTKQGKRIAAYLEVYAMSTEDKPPKDYFSRKFQ
jgi:hypothetical protein